MIKTKEEIEEILKNATNWNTAKLQDMVGDRTKKIHTLQRIQIQPCNQLGYCPYGYLVEFFPLEERDEYSCEIFGHDCPVYYLAEGFMDDDEGSLKDMSVEELIEVDRQFQLNLKEYGIGGDDSLKHKMQLLIEKRKGEKNGSRKNK